MSETKPKADGGPLPELEFNEAAYLAAFPFVLPLIQSGKFKSGLDHYNTVGHTQKRLAQPVYRRAFEAHRLTVVASPAAPADGPAPPPQLTPHGIDTVLIGDGEAMLVGWIDDRRAPLHSLVLVDDQDQEFPLRAIARCRRADAEVAVGAVGSGHLLGVWGLATLAGAGRIIAVRLVCAGHESRSPVSPRLMDGPALRDSAFDYLLGAQYFGNPAVDAAVQLDGGLGDALIDLNLSLSRRYREAAYVERFGPPRESFRASIIVCLFGKVEFFFIQQALFSAGSRAADYEFVYVCNSPELSEPLQREARIAAQIYGLSTTLVLLPGNAGFGAANNAAVHAARSQRVIICNPDVFPRDPEWLAQHEAILAACPPVQTRLFGAPLYYDDGALMHAGMYLESDRGLSVRPEGFVARDLLRVEHYGKGAPPNYAPYLRSRPVPAVTGALICADRDVFLALGGFSEEYVFGHYEDADLCLKHWRAGGEVWLQSLPMWHLEGKGSTRKRPHEGGSLLNRWHFTRVWSGFVQDGLIGRAPAQLATADGEQAHG